MSESNSLQIQLKRQLAFRLKKLRKQNHFTQEEVAHYLGVRRTTYAYYEIGRTAPTLANLVLLSFLFCVSLEELLGLVPDTFI